LVGFLQNQVTRWFQRIAKIAPWEVALGTRVVVWTKAIGLPSHGQGQAVGFVTFVCRLGSIGALGGNKQQSKEFIEPRGGGFNFVVSPPMIFLMEVGLFTLEKGGERLRLLIVKF